MVELLFRFLLLLLLLIGLFFVLLLSPLPRRPSLRNTPGLSACILSARRLFEALLHEVFVFALASSTHFSHSTNCRLHDPPFMYAQSRVSSSSSSSLSRSSSFDCCVPVMMKFLSLFWCRIKKVKTTTTSRRRPVERRVPRRDARPRPRARPRAFSRVEVATLKTHFSRELNFSFLKPKP